MNIGFLAADDVSAEHTEERMRTFIVTMQTDTGENIELFKCQQYGGDWYLPNKQAPDGATESAMIAIFNASRGFLAGIGVNVPRFTD